MLIITLVSLLMAATMGWLALRLLREEQRRSEARMMALTAALDEPAPRVRTQTAVLPQLVSIAADGSDAYFAAAAHQPVSRPVVHPVPVTATPNETVTPAEPLRQEAAADASPVAPPSERALFGVDASETTPRDDRRWLPVAIVVLIGLGVLSVLWSTSGTSTTPTAAAVTASAPAPGGIPLDLVSLGHEQSASTLVVRGLVRNPPAGSARTGTVASVFLFDEAGGFLGSSRSALDAPTLMPGADAAFEVSFPANTRVRRYRVTFRNVEGVVVPHLDKRTSGGVRSEAR